MKSLKQKLRSLVLSLTTALPLAAIPLLGCESFDPGSRVTTLRVLAVEADKPYAEPGESVHLQALWHDPSGRAVNWAWAACTNPASQSVQDCLAKVPDTEAGPELLQMGASDNVDYAVPEGALDELPAEVRVLAQVGIVTVACPGEIAWETSRLTELPVRCLDAENHELGLGEFVVGIKHVRVRQQDRNDNPEVARVTFDGKTWPADEIKTISACDSTANDFAKCEGDSHELAAVVTKGSFEKGQSEFDVQFEEQLVVQYYATEGTFEYEVKIAAEPETRFVARRQARGKDLLVWFVVRDDRGGVTWTERHVHVKP